MAMCCVVVPRCPYVHSPSRFLRCTWHLYIGAPPADSPRSHPTGQALLHMTVWWLLSQAVPTPSLIILSHPQTHNSQSMHHCLIYGSLLGVKVEHTACILSARTVAAMTQQTQAAPIMHTQTFPPPQVELLGFEPRSPAMPVHDKQQGPAQGTT
jgi:hypothetical protein